MLYNIVGLSLISGLGHVTAEKQAPSPLDYLGSIQEAVSIEKRLAPTVTSSALKDVLNRVIATYNKMCSNRRHKVDTEKKKLIQNMFLCWISVEYILDVFLKSLGAEPIQTKRVLIPTNQYLRLRLDAAAQQEIHKHYDLYAHAQSGGQVSRVSWDNPRTIN